MKRLLQVSAWLLATAIVVLSITPAHIRPVIAPKDFEHFAAFFILGLVVGIAYSGSYVTRAVVLLAFTALVEILQLGVPGRHARVEDFLVDALGCLVGLGLASTAKFLIERIAPRLSSVPLCASRQESRKAEP